MRLLVVWGQGFATVIEDVEGWEVAQGFPTFSLEIGCANFFEVGDHLDDAPEHHQETGDGLHRDLEEGI